MTEVMKGLLAAPVCWRRTLLEISLYNLEAGGRDADSLLESKRGHHCLLLEAGEGVRAAAMYGR